MGKVLIIMGSKSDMEIAEKVQEVLQSFEVPFHTEISSAHRMPEKTRKLATHAQEQGYQVIITIAGYSAHLGGVVASLTILPVITIPVSSSPLQGLDSIFSTIQMPGGVPLATMSLDKAGAKNAALFAIEILSLSDPHLRNKLKEYRVKLSQS
ncbi:MAG: 5-(carboxyamino)imidazole ribonucleotide mutase [bacterium]